MAQIHPVADPLLAGDDHLPDTEKRLAASVDLDAMSTLQVLQLLTSQDRVAVEAVAAAAPQLALLVDTAAERLRRGGSVHYFGAGTSGRLAVLDAAELLPTFNLDRGVVVAHMAGGPEALATAIENVEDSREEGAHDAAALGPDDVAIGITASGNTPYVGGALAAASERGAYTALISCNPRATLATGVDLDVVLATGPEVITGSTRLKAGTAEKLALNGFSTTLMVALGRTWSNLMVSVVATNAKLRRRTIRILMQASGLTEAASVELLARTEGDLKVAIVAAVAPADPDPARRALAAADGSVRDALRLLSAASA
ncbi:MULTISPECIES: N-acetylmuramic acid 6-phosphate etherase [unclassified Microbacterium]|uniref:N-acetylmuramic acid 6-phosphate etherase n=1 Tax=unclassified Microbacterium TaxID=2609290 RepID=UPI0037477413